MAGEQGPIVRRDRVATAHAVAPRRGPDHVVGVAAEHGVQVAAIASRDQLADHVLTTRRRRTRGEPEQHGNPTHTTNQRRELPHNSSMSSFSSR